MSKKKDIFDTVFVDDIDLAPYDEIDNAELDIEEKILYSDEFKSLLKEELAQKVDGIPFQKLIEDGISKQLAKKDFPSLINKTKESIETKIDQESYREKYRLNEELKKLGQEIKEKYASIRNILNSQEKYTFGGFAPPNPSTGANGTFLENTNGTWAGLVWGAASGGGGGNPTYIGDPSTANWRLYDDGTNLLVQNLVGGVWVEKGSFLP